MSATSSDYGKNHSAISTSTVSSLSHSARPSRRINEYNNDESVHGTALNTFRTFNSQFTALETIVTTLQSTGLPGPILLISVAEYIGSGSQFVVYKQKAAVSTNGPGFRSRIVAVKQPKFRIDPDQKVNLSDPSLRKYLHDMYLEILALTIPRLREHPNIARLFGWSYQNDAFHKVPLLIMDLAFENLETFLNIETNQTSLASRTSLCYGVGLGLDAIHECEIIHGDLKPANVLLFIENNQLVAKLADFGLCTHEAYAKRGVRLGGTPGWRAPEVEEQALLCESDLVRADNYSYGLLLWRVVLHRGQVCSPDQLKDAVGNVTIDFQVWSPIEERQHFAILERAIVGLLAPENQERPLQATSLLCSLDLVGLTSFVDAMSTDSEDDDSTYSELQPVPYPSEAYFRWELSPISSLFRIDLYDRFLKEPESFSLDVLEALFLDMTLYVDIDSSESTGKSTGNDALNVLCIAALNGSQASRAMITSAYRTFRLRPHPEVEKRVKEWLISATESGSILASHELEIMKESDAAEDSLDYFRRCGGYNQYFDDTFPNLEHNGYQSSDKSCEEHKLQEALISSIKFESLEVIETSLQELKNVSPNVPSLADKALDSLLYYACTRGSWAVAKQLLAVGCTAQWKEPAFNLGCLHWVFAIRTEDQDDAIRILLSKGADLEIVASEVVPLPFAPFLLPAGTALHWAVVISCNQTIDLLLDHGANPLTRDGSDPYLFDDDVRPLDKFGGLDSEGFSVPKGQTLGLTPLDYAAIRYSPHIFRALRARNLEIDINSSDEEGFTALHRLSTGTVHRTRLGIQYSLEPMQPTNLSRPVLVAETLQAILAIGGDLEIFTYRRPYDNTWTSDEYTPLMLAVQRGEAVVVRCLLEAGAKVQTRNGAGKTALHFCPLTTSKDNYLEIVKLLCEYGADVQAADKKGQTPLIMAARERAFSAVEYLLSAGANIDVHYKGTQTINSSREREVTICTIFNLLVTENTKNSTNLDSFVADLLENYVVKHHDESVRRKLLGMTEVTHTPLLYQVAMSRMPRCVVLLLRQGVDPNIKKKQWRFQRHSNVAQVWYETPLDGLLKDQLQRRTEMERDNIYSAEEYEQICTKGIAIENLLRDAGGHALLSGEEHVQGFPNLHDLPLNS